MCHHAPRARRVCLAVPRVAGQASAPCVKSCHTHKLVEEVCASLSRRSVPRTAALATSSRILCQRTTSMRVEVAHVPPGSIVHTHKLVKLLYAETVSLSSLPKTSVPINTTLTSLSGTFVPRAAASVSLSGRSVPRAAELASLSGTSVPRTAALTSLSGRSVPYTAEFAGLPGAPVLQTATTYAPAGPPPRQGRQERQERPDRHRRKKEEEGSLLLPVPYLWMGSRINSHPAAGLTGTADHWQGILSSGRRRPESSASGLRPVRHMPHEQECPPRSRGLRPRGCCVSVRCSLLRKLVGEVCVESCCTENKEQETATLASLSRRSVPRTAEPLRAC